MTSPDDVLARARRVVDQLREDLAQRHGWTHVDARLSLGPDNRLVLQGEAVVDRVVAAVKKRVAAVVPTGWSFDASDFGVMAGGGWRKLEPGVHRLFARLDRETTGWGAWVELTDRDDPVQVLAEVDDMVLVRGRDATVGWLEEGLGTPTEPRPIAAPRGENPEPMIAAARTVLGVPYVLGAATAAGIDCSALVQFAVDPLGLLLPRHSSDQLQIDPHHGLGRQPGDLVFAWNEREALCHVGIATGPTVVHASRSRGLVVEDPMSAFEQDSRQLMHVPFTSLIAFVHRLAGLDSLTAAGFAMGRPPPSPPE